MTIHVIDIGNTRLKWGVFKENKLADKRVFHDLGAWKTFSQEIPTSEVCVTGSVGNDASWMQHLSESHTVYHAQTHWSLPITSEYETMTTLGTDRIAAVCGAAARFEGPCLIFDAGTCLTIDFVDGSGYYRGGNISPGWRMRMRAMHEGTENLPLEEAQACGDILGRSTGKALQGGGFWGYVFEIQGYVRSFRDLHDDLNILLTGGDAYELAKYLKLEIFVEPDLVLYGLHQMYKTHYA